ncbi:MAG: hypothetical protein HOW73_32210 [Polyangiaceae bacterium]|nr:hypothetical protein [Polyangiaceae bacterium]
MSLRDEYIDDLVDDAVDPYADLLSPLAMKHLRSAVQDALEAHPVLSQLVDEHAPRGAVDQSAEMVDGKPVQADPLQQKKAR